MPAAPATSPGGHSSPIYATVTGKIGGSSMPCKKRHRTSEATSPANAAPIMGTTTASMAAVITRFLPKRSASAPVNGAVMAIANVLAVMMPLISAAPAPNSRASVGKRACGEYRLRNAQKPATATAALRERDAMAGTVKQMSFRGAAQREPGIHDHTQRMKP